VMYNGFPEEACRAVLLSWRTSGSPV
jgi:hypothetical protein